MKKALAFVLFGLLTGLVVVSAQSTPPADKDAGAAGTWPALRGPLATGVAPDARPPLEWSETKNLRFKVELPGPGHASPVVWGDRIYLLAAVRVGPPQPTKSPDAPPPPTIERKSSSGLAAPAGSENLLAAYSAQQEPEPPSRPAGPPGRSGGPPRAEAPTEVHRFVVLALDRATGKRVWQTVVREAVPHEGGHPTASQASATPVTDGEFVFASFGSQGLYCLDRTGKVKWEKDFGDMRTRNEFGEGSSPVLHGDTLVLNWDHEGDSFIVALDKRTGEERWRVAREEPTSWATPLVVQDGARALVVVAATNRVRAYDLATGAEVWQVGGLGANCIPSPVADAETLFVMSGYRDPAGIAIRYPGARGDLTGGPAVAWRVDRGLSYVPSPLLYDGKLYFVKRFSDILACHDLKTGEAHYEEQRLEGLGNVYASPVGAAGRVYVIDREGSAVVFRAGTKFELLAQNKLDDAFDASPAIVGDTLYLRGHRYLYAVAESK